MERAIPIPPTDDVEIRRPPRSEPWGARTFGVIDPFGNTIFVMGPVTWSTPPAAAASHAHEADDLCATRHASRRRFDVVIDRVAWVAFSFLLPLLWASGVWLFFHSDLGRRKKVLWSLFLLGVGVVIGVLLPLRGIRNRFIVIVALLPALAFIDVKLAKSNRTFLFWVRACAFEVCTVFASAALTRLVLSGW